MCAALLSNNQTTNHHSRNRKSSELPPEVINWRAEQQLKVGQEILNGWTPSDIRASQLNDSDIALLLQAIEGGTDRPSWNTISSVPQHLKPSGGTWDRLKVQAGMLYREFTIDENCETVLQLVVPASKREELVKYFHDIPSSGHLGAEKTLEKVRHSFYWASYEEVHRRLLPDLWQMCSQETTHQKAPCTPGPVLGGRAYGKNPAWCSRATATL